MAGRRPGPSFCALLATLVQAGGIAPAAASDGTHVWVASGGTVTELNAATGALVKVLKGSGYVFEAPEAVSSDGKDVWVANAEDRSVTGFPA